MKVKQRFPWVVVSAAAAVVVVGVTAWLQIPVVTPAVKTGVPVPTLGFMRLDPKAAADVLAEQLAAYDPTPLFLPTGMNSQGKKLSAEEQANTGGPFSDLPPQLVFGKDRTNLEFAPIIEVPAGPVHGLALTDRREMPLAMGRADAVGGKLPGRSGVLEAVRAADHRVVFTQALPETDKQPEGDWQPMELLGAVSRFGLAGGLVVTVSSGSDAMDDYFNAQLTQVLRVGERLPPGFYTFRVGP